METVTTRIPDDDDVKALPEREAVSSADRPEVHRRLIRYRLSDWRRDRALGQFRGHTT